MYGNCRGDALDSQLISDAKMCADYPPPLVALLSFIFGRGYFGGMV